MLCLTGITTQSCKDQKSQVEDVVGNVTVYKLKSMSSSSTQQLDLTLSMKEDLVWQKLTNVGRKKKREFFFTTDI